MDFIICKSFKYSVYLYNKSNFEFIYIQGGPKKSLCMMWSRGKVWEILKYFLMEPFSLYIHIFSRSWSFLSYVEKKLWGFKNPGNGLFQKSVLSKKRHIFLLQNNSYSCLVLKFQVSKLKIAIRVTKLSIWPQKCVFLNAFNYKLIW